MADSLLVTMQAAHGELEGRIQDLTAHLEEAQAAAANNIGQTRLHANLMPDRS